MAVTMASADTILDRLGTQLPDLRGLYIDIPAAVPPRYDPALLATFLVGLDLAGTFILALSGAMAAIKHGLDLFGMLLLSLAAGNAGGLTRDVLLRAMPPPAISDRRSARARFGSTRGRFE